MGVIIQDKIVCSYIRLSEEDYKKDKEDMSASITNQISYIENYAKYQLGMQKPKESQVQKISIGKQDKIILPVEINEEEEKSLFENILQDVRKILD